MTAAQLVLLVRGWGGEGLTAAWLVLLVRGWGGEGCQGAPQEGLDVPENQVQQQP